MIGNCGECTRRWYCDDSPETCGAFPGPPPPTNADRIRGMSDEELAEWLTHLPKICTCHDHCELCIAQKECDKGCEGCIKDWLRQPAETEGTE